MKKAEEFSIQVLKEKQDNPKTRLYITKVLIGIVIIQFNLSPEKAIKWFEAEDYTIGWAGLMSGMMEYQSNNTNG